MSIWITTKKYKFWDHIGKEMLDDLELAGKSINEVLSMYGFIPLQFTGEKDKNGAEIYEDFYMVKGDVKIPVDFRHGAFYVGNALLHNVVKKGWVVGEYRYCQKKP